MRIVVLFVSSTVSVSAQTSTSNLLVDVSEKLPFVRELGGAEDGLAGAAWFDFDNDGFLDLFLPNVAGQPNALFRNRQDGTFTNVAAQAGVANGTGNSGVVAGDINNDGWKDLLLTYAGAEPDDLHTKLYLNQGNGTFADITAVSGLAGERSSLSAALADINNDGFLDVFMASLGTAPGLPTSRQFNNKLYLNNGDLTFTDISASSGANEDFGACAAAFTDYDQDGFPDLFVANCNDVNETPTPTELLRNNGNLTFTDVRNQAGVSAAWFWQGIGIGDYDNDGDQDFVLTSFGAGTGHALYEHQGNGTYLNRSVQARLATLELGFGVSFADFDNDGFQDLFMAGSLPIAGFNMIGPGRGNPGRLLMNNRDKTFSTTATFGLASKFTTGVAVGDFDNNGFPDVVVVTSKFVRSGYNPDGRPVLLQNAGNTNHWLTIKTVGTTSNRDGIGTRVRVTSGDLRQVKEVRAGSSLASMDSPWPTFGLGSAAMADTVRIEWPSGIVQELRSIAANQNLIVTEPVRLLATSRGAFQFRSWNGFRFTVELSNNLVDWTPLATVTNTTGVVQFTDPDAPQHQQRFYRVKSE
jgi:enediyne biosynthesis protein E4